MQQLGMPAPLDQFGPPDTLQSMSNINASAEKAHFLQEKLDKMQEMHDSQK